MADKVDPKRIKNRDDIWQLGRSTVEAVARDLHPDEDDPLFKFTVPEALALVSQVAGRMRPAVETYLPLSEQITVGQMLKFYGWRTWANYAGRAYDVWRILRMVNPAVAVTHEVREQASKRLMNWGRDEVTRRLAALFVEEVGRAAIDLYGGRLAVTDAELAAYVSPGSQQAMSAAKPAEPLRILIVSSDAENDFAGHLAERLGAPAPANWPRNKAGENEYLLPASAAFGEPTLLVLGPQLRPDEKERKIKGFKTRFPGLVKNVFEADLVIITLAQKSAPEQAAQPTNLAMAIRDIRRLFEAKSHRLPPPVLMVMPEQEPASPQHNARTQQQLAAELALREGNILFLPSNGQENGEAIKAHIAAQLPAAQAARLSRIRAASARKFNLSRSARQAANAGLALVRRRKK